MKLGPTWSLLGLRRRPYFRDLRRILITCPCPRKYLLEHRLLVRVMSLVLVLLLCRTHLCPDLRQGLQEAWLSEKPP